MLQRDFDPSAGTIEVFPRGITRVLLNFISNGFYAVSKRKAEVGGAGFEPMCLPRHGTGTHVEIRIRDNGASIPPEIKEKMLNLFFTTNAFSPFYCRVRTIFQINLEVRRECSRSSCG